MVHSFELISMEKENIMKILNLPHPRHFSACQYDIPNLIVDFAV
jgi:hypothetical protein